MMHIAWRSIEEVPYCFSRSYVKFQGHRALKIVEFDPNWAFPDSNSSLNSPMAMKCCTKLETAKERCPIVFQGHPSNFKVTRDKTSPILTQIGRFRTIGRSQLSNPSDLPCLSLVRRFVNDFHSWLRHLWKSLPNRLTRDKKSLFTVTHALFFISIIMAFFSLDLLWYSLVLILIHMYVIKILVSFSKMLIYLIFSWDQAALRTLISVCPSLCRLSHLLSYYHWQTWWSCKR